MVRAPSRPALKLIREVHVRERHVRMAPPNADAVTLLYSMVQGRVDGGAVSQLPINPSSRYISPAFGPSINEEPTIP